MLPNLKALAPVTAVGTTLLLLGLALLSVVVAFAWPQRPTEAITPTWSQIPLALCAILYSYEGICLVLPIESSTKGGSNFLSVFVSAMATAATIFALVASLCVAAFGAVTNGSITAFLLEQIDATGDPNHWKPWLLAANAAVSMSVLVTYPLQLFPVLELLTRVNDATLVAQEELEMTPSMDTEDDDDGPAGVVLEDIPQPATFSWRLRLTLVLLTYVMAAVVPNVQALIALAGALAGSSTALLIPPVLELAWLKQNGSPGRIRCYVLLAGGFIFMCIGTVASIVDIIRIYSGKG
jgi:proton-coupled amino acid transporter